MPQGGEREGFSSLPLLVGLLIRPSPGICALPSSGFSLSQGLRVSRHEEFYSLFMRIAWPIRRWEVELAALSRIFRIFAADMVSTFGRGLEAGFGAGPLVVWGEVRLGYALHRKGHDVAWPSWWACNISGGGAYIMGEAMEVRLGEAELRKVWRGSKGLGLGPFWWACNISGGGAYIMGEAMEVRLGEAELRKVWRGSKGLGLMQPPGPTYRNLWYGRSTGGAFAGTLGGPADQRKLRLPIRNEKLPLL